jgi:hypothetical protein
MRVKGKMKLYKRDVAPSRETQRKLKATEAESYN